MASLVSGNDDPGGERWSDDMAAILVGAVTPDAARLLAGIRTAAHETGERADGEVVARIL
jgi:hypothetical protein